jgi:hypothetical protein
VANNVTQRRSRRQFWPKKVKKKILKKKKLLPKKGGKFGQAEKKKLVAAKKVDKLVKLLKKQKELAVVLKKIRWSWPRRSIRKGFWRPGWQRGRDSKEGAPQEGKKGMMLCGLEPSKFFPFCSGRLAWGSFLLSTLGKSSAAAQLISGKSAPS